MQSTTANVTYGLIKPMTQDGQAAFVPLALAQDAQLAGKTDTELWDEIFERCDSDGESMPHE